ncbi:hypothetical protein N8T08_010603 [Aspergillus melleus]|uniref:Uncharacterized protein n=1 Tax=Aspergillus melleus TaxID=138277 RepID=A0ACC3ARS5_9EURO|nr:hypothetical protein N8T08_010603 [Aspergillus melleus]
MELGKVYGEYHGELVLKLAGTTVMLLDQMTMFTRKGYSRDICFITGAFLWASWRRLIALEYHYRLGQTLEYGWSQQKEPGVLRNSYSHSHFVEVQYPDSYFGHLHPEYMCSWVWNLLKRDKSFIGFGLCLLIPCRAAGTRSPADGAAVTPNTQRSAKDCRERRYRINLPILEAVVAPALGCTGMRRLGDWLKAPPQSVLMRKLM